MEAATQVRTHTPGPWRVTEDKLAIEAKMRNGKWYDIARTDSTDEPGAKWANADFIVRACNAYGDLLAALQDARAMIAAIAVGRPNVTHSAAVSLGHKIAAAIAKAQP